MVFMLFLCVFIVLRHYWYAWKGLRHYGYCMPSANNILTIWCPQRHIIRIHIAVSYYHSFIALLKIGLDYMYIILQCDWLIISIHHSRCFVNAWCQWNDSKLLSAICLMNQYQLNYIYIIVYHTIYMYIYPMLRADSRFWLVNNREIWSRISRLTSSAWDIKTKERHWWRHNGDSDRRPLSLPLRYDLVILCLYDDLGQINVIAGILKLRKRFRMSQILSEHGINSLPLVYFRGYGNLSTLSIAIPRLAFGRAWYCDAACG